MDILFTSVGQLAVGFIVASTLLLIATIVYDSFKTAFRFVDHTTERLSTDAVILRPGAWQYNDTFFNKITEFRNDFV